MSEHRILCADQKAIRHPVSHIHIVSVGIEPNPPRVEMRLSIDQVYKLIDQGDSFYVRGWRTGKVAGVRKTRCPYCGADQIQSLGMDQEETKLSSLGFCSG